MPRASTPTQPETDTLEQLLFLALECLSRGDDDGLQSLCRAHAEHADALRAEVARLRETGLIDVGPTGDAGRIPDRLGDFRLLQRIGGGGMGVVYSAVQESLNRRVAIKIVRPEHLYFADSRARFRREVEAVAMLEHPAIVRLHTVGEEGGLPYYAMEFVEGESLSQVLQRLAGRSPAELDGAVLLAGAHGNRRFPGGWAESAVRVVRDVAEALAHAHSRGVLHRDVKPSNVMLTPAGEVRLVDFGLALHTDASPLTRAGAQPGSLPYMAPEQLGHDREVDERTDVYGLGVTLYELLTLRRPFEGADSRAVQRKILAGSPPSPRRFNHALSHDLLTVCARAMAVEPAERYESAQAFADDLDNLLAFRPIQARRAGPILRLRRWAQRRPTEALSFCVGALLIMGSTTMYVVQDQRSRTRLRSVNEELRSALEVADRRLEQAGEIVELASSVAREMLHQPQNAAASRALRERTMEFYLSALEIESLEPRHVRVAIDARQKLARDQRFAGDWPAAERTLRDALELVERIPESDREPRMELAAIGLLQAIASTIESQRVDAESSALVLEADRRLAQFLVAHPRDVEARRRLAIARWRVGRAHLYEGRLLEALTEYERTLHIEAELVEDHPGVPMHVAYWCNTLCHKATAQRRLGRLEEAHATLLFVLERLAAIEGDTPDWSFDDAQVATTYHELALVLDAMQRSDEAVLAAENAFERMQQLVDDQPWDANIVEQALRSWIELGELFESKGSAHWTTKLSCAATRLAPQALRTGGELRDRLEIVSRVEALRAREAARDGNVEVALEAWRMALMHATRASELGPASTRLATRVSAIQQEIAALTGEDDGD